MKTGRPKKTLEAMKFDGWDQLDTMIVFGSEMFCAEKLGLNIDTLAARIKEKYGCSFSEYKKKRREPLMINLLRKQYDVAMTGNVSMLIWLGKQYLGQTDKIESQETFELVTEFTKDETSIVNK